jgi:lipopolysaccharide transport system permease protein
MSSLDRRTASVSPSGGYAIVNSNHIPDGTLSAAIRTVSSSRNLDSRRCPTYVEFTSATTKTDSMAEIIIIEPGRYERNYWHDLWRYRELFRVLAWRDLAVRYKQTVIGAAWAVIRPFVTMIVFTVIFGRIAKLPSDGTSPYALMVFAGMLPWTFFSTGLSEASNSLINNANLISKVYFPRLIVPTATVVVAFVDFLISFAMLLLLMAWYQYPPGWRMLVLPALTLLAFLASMGSALWITALNVKYRDFRYVIPFIVQFGLYVSPVGFSSNLIPSSGACSIP